MIKNLFISTTRTINIGLLFIRIGLGFVFIIHGYSKFIGGSQLWSTLGAIVPHVGIKLLPASFWGFAAACAEFFGGILFILGFGTRLAALSITLVMIFAILIHTTKGDPFTITSHPLSLLILFLGFMISGAGDYSLDHMISKKLRS
jgi:putative oxidoreductase